ncbi:MAG: hypothetical protein MR510_15875 [Clostridium sp.]|jgi:hypothetical protein|uniref:hypothetical protein n=1 Tax=Clostridium sp. TaxID=1506 RepID=UPI0025E613F7|nr:hypothetical protein [Clostridium sp.]MCI6693920.1 hypothetical protein [Clostridium sp.]MDY2629866.1 hypothetical protein [Clostridium sp.]MDY6227688.1 hypothetical protein [Clostridium sp.]
MLLSTNPAVRLYEILSKSKEFCSNNAKKQSRFRTVESVIAQVFDLDMNDDEKVFKAIIEIIQMIENIKKLTNKIESNSKDELVKLLTNFEKRIMALGLDDDIHKLDNIITNEILISINGLALALDVCNQYRDIEEENLNKFREKIRNLIDELEDLEVNNELKLFINNVLYDLYIRIEEYKIYGIEGLKISIEQGLGSIMLNRNICEEASKNKGFKESIKKILSLLTSINTTISFAKNIIPIAQEANDIVNRLLD